MQRTDTDENTRRSAGRGAWLNSVPGLLALFAGTAALSLLLLLAVTRIPRSAIRDNVLDSAQYLCEGELFGVVVDVPCAPENAIDEVKAVCRHIVASHNDSPIADLIGRISSE